MKLYFKFILSALLIAFVGSLSFGFAQNCKDQPAPQGSPRKYTCEYSTTTVCASVGAINSWPSYGGCSGGTKCHLCVCPGGTSWKDGKCQKEELICDESNGFVLNTDKTACVCPQEKENIDGKCVDKVSGPALGECGKDGKLTTDKTQCQCPDNSLVALGVDCPTTPSPKTETEEVKCGKDQPVTDKCTCDGDFTNVDGICKSCDTPGVCCGVKLNTNVPFIGRCISFGKDADSSDTTVVTEATAFPILMGALTKIMITFLLLICFGGILVGGVMIASSGGDTKRASDGKSLIGKVIIAIAVLGASGIILHLINPNFF